MDNPTLQNPDDYVNAACVLGDFEGCLEGRAWVEPAVKDITWFQRDGAWHLCVVRNVIEAEDPVRPQQWVVEPMDQSLGVSLVLCGDQIKALPKTFWGFHAGKPWYYLPHHTTHEIMALDTGEALLKLQWMHQLDEGF